MDARRSHRHRFRLGSRPSLPLRPAQLCVRQLLLLSATIVPLYNMLGGDATANSETIRPAIRSFIVSLGRISFMVHLLWCISFIAENRTPFFGGICVTRTEHGGHLIRFSDFAGLDFSDIGLCAHFFCSATRGWQCMAHHTGTNSSDSAGVAGRVCFVSLAVGHVRHQLHEGESTVSALGGIAVDSCGQHPRPGLP